MQATYERRDTGIGHTYSVALTDDNGEKGRVGVNLGTSSHSPLAFIRYRDRTLTLRMPWRVYSLLRSLRRKKETP